MAGDKRYPRSQAQKFTDLARQLECDESEEGFGNRLRKLARAPSQASPRSPKMPKWNRLAIYQRDHFHCRYCDFDGSTFEGWRYLTIDHVNLTGSRDDPDNLATCCSYCNSCKSSDPCLNIDEAKEIVARHDASNRAYWAKHIEPRLELAREEGFEERLRLTGQSAQGGTREG